MDRLGTMAVPGGVAMTRLAAILPMAVVAILALPAQAASPAELGSAAREPGEYSLTPPRQSLRIEPAQSRAERPAYPTDTPRVPVNDALRPPQLIWIPSPASLVKLVPTKVRYKLQF